jgi:DNA-binding CsgD family transcriptional regulator
VRDAAGADATAQGAGLTLADALAWARRARGARTQATAGWPALSPTELRVAELVAQGLSNPEIGARMFISRETVKSHLGHVFAKVGVRNRAELAALAGRRVRDGGPTC